MAALVLRRVVVLVPILLVVGSVVFALVHLVPGDPAAVMLGPEAAVDQVEQLRARLGLNDSLPVQFARWFGGVLRLDFGDSLFIDKPVIAALGDRVQPTALLTLYALVLSIAIGVPAGVLAAVRQNSLVDRVLMAVAIAGAALPSFFLGILLILLLAVVWRWVPSGGYVEISESLLGHIKTMVLPSFSLGFAAAGILARLVRASMLDVLHDDFVRTALAKGLSDRTVTVGHVLRNALIPIITVIGYSLGSLLGGAVVTETVFNVPGMGRLVVESVARRDFPVIQGAVMVTAGVYVVTNLLVDILYALADPRVRYR